MNHKMPLGADYTPARTVFRLWAPRASGVLLQRFTCGSDDEPGAFFLGETQMEALEGGYFQAVLYGNLKNQYYQYFITDCAGMDTWSADPWALACGVNGNRSMVVDLASTNPVGWSQDRGPALNGKAPVIWEAHVRDFSGDPRSGVSLKHRGTYLAFTEQDTTLDHAGVVPTCLNYLKQLGVTHIQLQPIYDYCTVDERKAMQGYNWGYDPLNYNVPEGSYSTDPFHGAVRVRECKEMIRAIHQAGLGVIMDVVYNHTYDFHSWFQRTAPGYFYRMMPDGTPGNASGCGTETASENPCFREYMVESVLYWAQEYHIDGFRFDLMGIHDVETMRLIRKRLDELPNGKQILTYGEPWSALPPAMPKGIYPANKEALKKLDVHMGIFCDDTRNLLAGSPFEDLERGYGSGKHSPQAAEVLRQAVLAWSDPQRGGYARSPAQIVQYVSCHDNFSLWDRLRASKADWTYDKPTPDRLKQNQFIAGIYLTLPGLAFFQSGEEFGRTKYGSGNSYAGPAQLNELQWARTVPFESLVRWYQGLVGLRQELYPYQRMTPSFRKRIRFLEVPGNCVGFTLSGTKKWSRVAVFYNPHQEEQTITLPLGRWRLLCDGEDSSLWQKRQCYRLTGSVTLAPMSVTIFAGI